MKNFHNPNYELHFQNRNISILLRKIVNHPYMICYPLNSKGEYDITENIIKISNKMKILDRLLDKLKISNHKVLIFSQFNDMLNILQDYLNYKKWQYSRIDGSMSIEDRNDQIDWFTVDPNIFCFLLNTKTGGVGINLSVADTVIIYDSDWNPQCDIQAQDRCHRIGQLNPVLIFRFILKDTIDQYVINKATVKRNFEKTILHGKKFKGNFFEKNDDKNYQDFDKDNYNTNVESFNCMSKNEMIDLLTFRVNEKIINFDILTDNDIEQLLDRSNLQD